MSSAKWRQFYLGLNVLTLAVHDSLHWRHNEGDGFTSLKIVYSTVFLAQIKENVKAPRHWPLCGEFTGDRWIPHTKAQ